VEEGRGNGTLERLEEDGKKRGLPSRLIEFYIDILSVQKKGEKLIGRVNPGLKTDTINERLEKGRPLINFDELAIDWPILNDLLIQVTGVFTDYNDLFGELPESLTKPKPRKSLPKSVARAWFKGNRLPKSMATDDIDEHLMLEAIIHATLKPYMVSYAKSLAPLINQERWRRDYCPVCGGKPDFAFLDNERGSRWLLCSRCDTEWLFQRMECPFCGSQEQNDLSYYTDDKGLYRLYVCDNCHKYIKSIDLRVADPEVQLPLERLLTLDLDRQAQDEGYEPGNI